MSALVPWSGRTNLARLVVDEQTTAVAGLPGSADVDPFERLAAAFIVGYPANSARAYIGDLQAWASWCVAMGVHPFDARRHHVDAWVRTLSTEPTARTAKPMASSSVRRRLSAVSKFYKYGIEVGVLTYSPVDQVRRPAPDDQMHTVALTSSEVDAILDVAEAHSPDTSPWSRSSPTTACASTRPSAPTSTTTASSGATGSSGSPARAVSALASLSLPRRSGRSTPTSTTTTPWLGRSSWTAPGRNGSPMRLPSSRSDA